MTVSKCESRSGNPVDIADRHGPNLRRTHSTAAVTNGVDVAVGFNRDNGREEKGKGSVHSVSPFPQQTVRPTRKAHRPASCAADASAACSAESPGLLVEAKSPLLAEKRKVEGFTFTVQQGHRLTNAYTSRRSRLTQ
jgi:hypothetical protein